MIASTWKGKEYIKEYAVPGGEPSDRQLEQRGLFNQAVEAWKGLSPLQQRFYDRIADGMTGYNLFVGRATQAFRAGRGPETPMPFEYATEDGSTIPDGDLIVRQGTSRNVWVDGLKDGKGEIALTASDAPYTFVLRRNAQEDIVATVSDLLEIDVPLVLESEALGIRLVLNVPPGTAPNPPVEGGATA